MALTRSEPEGIVDLLAAQVCARPSRSRDYLAQELDLLTQLLVRDLCTSQFCHHIRPTSSAETELLPRLALAVLHVLLGPNGRGRHRPFGGCNAMRPSGEPELARRNAAWSSAPACLEMAEKQGISLSVALFERFTLPRSRDEGDAITATQNDGKGVDYFLAATRGSSRRPPSSSRRWPPD